MIPQTSILFYDGTAEYFLECTWEPADAELFDAACEQVISSMTPRS